jgi:hypothetical protein
MMSDNWLPAAAAPRLGWVLPEVSGPAGGAWPTTAATAALVRGRRVPSVPAGAAAAAAAAVCVGVVCWSAAMLPLPLVSCAGGGAAWLLLMRDSSDMMYSMRKSADHDSLGDSKQTLAAAATACTSRLGVLVSKRRVQLVLRVCGYCNPPFSQRPLAPMKRPCHCCHASWLSVLPILAAWGLFGRFWTYSFPLGGQSGHTFPVQCAQPGPGLAAC